MTGTRLLKLIVEIRYGKNVPEPFNFREKILSKITSEEVKRQQNIIDGFGMLIKKRNTKIVIESNRAGADIVVAKSIPNSSQYATDNILKVFKLIGESIEVKHVERIGVRSNWIKTADSSLDELVSKFKDVFYKDNNIINQAKDVAVALTLKDGDNKVNYNAAPLSQNELKNMINQNLKDYGHDEEEVDAQSAIYIDYDYFSDKESKYSTDSMVRFVTSAMKNADRTVSETLELFK